MGGGQLAAALFIAWREAANISARDSVLNDVR